MLRPEQLFLAITPVDMRRGIDTLTQYVTDNLHADWGNGAAFAFCNRAAPGADYRQRPAGAGTAHAGGHQQISASPAADPSAVYFCPRGRGHPAQHAQFMGRCRGRGAYPAGRGAASGTADPRCAPRR